MNAVTLHKKEVVSVGSHKVAVVEDSLPSTDSVFYKKAKELTAFSGAASLDEIHSLGKVLRTNTDLKSIFSEANLITEAKVIAHLANIAPDFLIAVHNYTSTVLPIIKNAESTLKLLSADNLGKFAIEISHLDRSELQELKSQIQGMEGGARPIWATFKESSIIGMGDRQFRSYLNRLRLQPGGEAILRNVHTNNTGFTDRMSRLIGASYCSEITALGKDVLDYLRSAARGIDRNKFIPITPQELAGEDLNGLRTFDGKEFSLPPQLIIKLATISHDAFRNARATVAGEVPPSASLRNPARDCVQTDFGNLTNENRNLTIINSLSFALDFAQSDNADFEIFKDKAIEGNPSGIKLVEREHIEAPISEKVSVWEPAATAKDQLDIAYQKVKKEMAELTIADQPVIESMHNYLDSIEALPLSAEVQKCMQCLKGLYRARKDLAVSRYIELMTDTSSEIKEKTFHTYRDKLEEVKLVSKGIIAGRHYTESLNPESLELYGHNIVALIRRFESSRQPLMMKKQGCLLSNNYDINFLRSFIEEGNKIIVHRDREANSKSVNGVFLFSTPENFPEYAQSLNLDRLARISLAELIAIDPERPGGTNSRMFRRMMAELQATDATHSMGYVNSENARQISALTYTGHELLLLGRSQVIFDSGLKADYIPAIIPVHPRLIESVL